MSTLPASFDTRAADSLLHNCIRGNGDFFALAAQHGLSLDQFIAWFHADVTQRRIRDLAAIADARTALLARLNRAAAVTRLAQVVTIAQSTVHESVRAAAALLRTARDFERREASTRDGEAQNTDARAANYRASPASPAITESPTHARLHPRHSDVPAATPRQPAIGRHAHPYPLAESASDSTPALAQSHRDPNFAVDEADHAAPEAALRAFTEFRSEVSPSPDSMRPTAPRHPTRRPSIPHPSLGPPVFAGA